MTSPPAGTPQETTQQLAAAIEAGDMILAENLLERLGQAADQRLHAAVAGVYMRQSRWADAIRAFDRIPNSELNIKLQRQLAINLSVLQTARPQQYETILKAKPQTRCEVSQLASGLLTIVQTQKGQKPVSPSRGPHPDRHAEQMLTSVARVIGARNPLLLAGIGDGYLVSAISKKFAGANSDFLSTVYLIEPDPEVIVNCMMIHDFTLPHGPILCENFRWYIGPQWAAQLHHTLENDLFMSDPASTITLSLHGDKLTGPIQQILLQRVEPSRQLKKQVEDYYRTLSREHFLSVLGPTPPRPPRVMVVTCRFTTVLQYSARDTVDAFEQLGWQAELLIEPSPYHRLTYAGTHQAMLAFKPDLILCIDHLRYETKGLYPENLPYVCWIQDNLANLTTPRAGESIGVRDFVLTANRPTYCNLYSYPKAQCIDMGKLTRTPARPDHWTSDGDDLAYVSNASRTGEQLTEKLMARTAADDAGKRLLRVCCDQVVALYRNGRCLETSNQILQLVHSVEREVGFKFKDEMIRQSVVAMLTHPLNDALYRQQGLQWAARIAHRLGLKFGVYGNGWETHPSLAAYARGPVAYGEALEAQTRRTKINLRLEPYPSMAHQRMIDGLIAGGFFLHRQNDSESKAQALADFLHQHVPATTESVEAARAAISPQHRPQLDALVEASAQTIATDHDQVEGVRVCQEIGLLAQHGPALPRLEEISFWDEASLQKRIEHFLRSPPLRQDIAHQQRQHIENKMTYTAGMRRAVSRIRQRIAAEVSCVPCDQSVNTSQTKANA